MTDRSMNRGEVKASAETRWRTWADRPHGPDEMVMLFGPEAPFGEAKSIAEGLRGMKAGDLVVVNVPKGALPEGVADTCAKLAVCRSLTVRLSFAGWDEDPREVWDIPEICEWARQFVLAGGLPSLDPSGDDGPIGAMLLAVMGGFVSRIRVGNTFRVSGLEVLAVARRPDLIARFSRLVFAGTDREEVS